MSFLPAHRTSLRAPTTTGNCLPGLLPTSVFISRRQRQGRGGVRSSSQSMTPLVMAPEEVAIDFSIVKGVLFDVDGTLCNSDPIHFKAFQEILQEVGFDDGKPISEEFFRKHISGRHNPEIARDLLPSWSAEQHVAFYTDKEARYRAMAASKLVPLPGLLDLLAWVDSRGLRKAAVTNAPKANTELMLKALGLSNYFETVVLGEECTRAKPFPDPYQRALQTLGLQPHEALVMEDSPAGITAGVAAGIKVVGLLTGQPREALVKAGATVIVDDFRDVLAMIERQQALRPQHEAKQ